MKFIVLDDVPPWTTYLLGIIVLGGFLLALAMLLRSWKTSRRDARSAWIGRHLWFLTILGALAVWFLGSSMYFRFHGIRIGAQHFDLVYFWPRPDVILGINDPVDVQVLHAGRTCGHLVVTTPRETFRSVNFKKCEDAEQLLSFLKGLKKLDS